MRNESDASLAKILAGGPLSEDEILRRLCEAGADDPEAEFDAQTDEIGCPAGSLTDDRWVWLPALMSTRILTHRVSADEVTLDMLEIAPDLGPLTDLCDNDQFGRFTDGSHTQIALPLLDDELLESRGIPPESVDVNGVLLLAPGTLAELGVSEGELVGLRLTERGFAVEAIEAEAHLDVGARLAALLDDEPTELDSAIWTLCTDDAALFTQPLPPLSEIADSQGLARRGAFLAPAGFDFELWNFEGGCELLAERYGLDEEDAVALYTLTKLYERLSLLIETAQDDTLSEELSADDEDVADIGAFARLGGELGAVLADPRMAALLVSETAGRDHDGAAALGLLAETLEPQVPRPARVACRWLRAVALEMIGDVEAAETELLAAESLDSDWAPVLYDLARYASDRGDVERGLSLLRRAGAEPDDPLVTLLERHRVAPRGDLGRNDACWCGSGRKYKRCHLGREPLPLADRAEWLYTKATHHALLSDWRDLVNEVVEERSRYAADDREVLAALADPLVIDATLFEGGAFEHFLEVRGSLLPEDERLLAEQWLLVDRSVFEVERVRRDQGVTVRDVRTGDTHEVREKTASRQLTAGQLICARVLPAGDTMLFFGGVEPVALHERDTLIDLLDAGPDPVDLVALLTRRFAPPALTNTEGDPLVICRATVHVSDPAAIKAALDETYDRVEDEKPPQWFEHVTTHGMERIRATVVLDGATLTAETNSEKRMDRVLATLASLDPGCEVVEDSREPVGDVRNAAELAAQMPVTGEGAFDPDSPEVVAALDELIRTYETMWLDEPIPALDGHTPRQAADDPTRRDDLIRLLDTFPAGEAAHGGMDADRLRAALGLG